MEFWLLTRRSEAQGCLIPGMRGQEQVIAVVGTGLCVTATLEWGDLQHFAEEAWAELSQKYPPGHVSPRISGGFQSSCAVQMLCWFLFLFLPVLQGLRGRISVGLPVVALAIQS